VIPSVAFALVFASMMLEAHLSRAHERKLRRLGAREPAGDVYLWMQFLYPAGFLLMIGEGVLRGAPVDRVAVCGAAVWTAAKALKYWAIATLGDRWTFRVLVPPASVRLVAGPYRWLRHPNYVAVVGEFAGVMMAMHAWYSGAPGITAFVALIARRISIEERALAQMGK
jgi:methyltransferase